MRIAVLSDTHNDMRNTMRALELIRRQSLGSIVHCGDITSLETLSLFADFDAYFVAGNMDREYADLSARAEALFGKGHFAAFLEHSFDGIAVAACHGHDADFSRLVDGGRFAWFFRGHTHRRLYQQANCTRVLNPGALGGLRRETCSFAVVDLETGGLQFVEL